MLTWPERRAASWTSYGKKLTNLWRRNTAMKRAIRLTVFYTAIIAIWVIVAKLRLWPPYLFPPPWSEVRRDRKSTRLNSSHVEISYAVFCLKKKNNKHE